MAIPAKPPAREKRRLVFVDVNFGGVPDTADGVPVCSFEFDEPTRPSASAESAETRPFIMRTECPFPGTERALCLRGAVAHAGDTRTFVEACMFRVSTHNP